MLRAKEQDFISIYHSFLTLGRILHYIGRIVRDVTSQDNGFFGRLAKFFPASLSYCVVYRFYEVAMFYLHVLLGEICQKSSVFIGARPR
jgi:hypothetical protein